MVELKIIAEMPDKDFKEADKLDITRLVERIERMDSSDRTKREYKGVLRRFYRWPGRDELVDGMKIPTRKDSRKLPEDLLSEIENMINICEHPRDKALVHLDRRNVYLHSL